jgi:N-acetylglucosaminyldiphosphoundecaprenol N-acetyl-beta-D-mannosaminyltransferase
MKTVEIGTLSLDAPDEEELLQVLDAFVEERSDGGRAHFVAFCEAHLFVRASREPATAAALERASLVLPDGVSMTAGARLLGQDFAARLPGPVVMLRFLRHGVPRGHRHFFYGGAEGVAPRLAERLVRQIPGLQVVGTYTPPFRPLTDREQIDVKARIEGSNADVVWVGLGAPKQERWMAAQQGRIKVPLMMGVGAAFDFHSGTRSWAPAWVRRAGVEWIYRGVLGGPRISKRALHYIPAFLGLLARAWLGGRRDLG